MTLPHRVNIWAHGWANRPMVYTHQQLNQQGVRYLNMSTAWLQLGCGHLQISIRSVCITWKSATQRALSQAVDTNSMSIVQFVWLNQLLSHNLAGRRLVCSTACRCYSMSTVDFWSPVMPQQCCDFNTCWVLCVKLSKSFLLALGWQELAVG